MTMTPPQMNDAQDRYPSALGAALRSGTEWVNATTETEYTPNKDKPRLPSLDLDAPTEPTLEADDDPVFAETGWLMEQGSILADHPLLRGLLLELPPKGSAPPPGWLDRWFEATRSILELLYVTDHR